MKRASEPLAAADPSLSRRVRFALPGAVLAENAPDVARRFTHRAAAPGPGWPHP